MNSKLNPINWQIFKLNEICITRSGIITSSEHYALSGESILYVKPKDIQFNTITSTSEHVSKDNIDKGGLQLVPKESILLAVNGATAGNIAFLGKDAMVNQNVLYATIRNSLVKPRFLYYYLYFKRNRLIKVSKYTLRASYRLLQQLEIPLPSLKEQERIIQYLDLQLSQTDISIEAGKEAISAINVEKQELLNSKFPFDAENHSSIGCTNLKMDDCGQVKAGKTPNGSIREYYGSTYPLFKPSDFQSEIQLKTAETHLSTKGLKIAGFIRANSLLVCCSGTNLGNVRMTQIDGACSQQIISFTPNEKLLPEFVYFQMSTDNFKKQLQKNAKNSMINLSDFKSLSLAVPSLQEQQSIVAALNLGISLFTKRASKISKRLHLLEAAKIDFLFRAFPSNSSGAGISQ